MRARLFGVSIVLALVGCAGEPATPPAARTDVATAPASLDRCPHGVLAVACAKCKPALVAVYQAKGDWCSEHGFAESFCPICNPAAGGRPGGAVSTDGAPAHGTKVRFKTLQAAEQAGITTTPAGMAPPTGGLQAVARIVYDAAKVASVGARAPGVVQRITADVGARVEAGGSLAVLESATVGADRSRVAAARATEALARADLDRKSQLVRDGVTAPRDVQAAEEALAVAQAEVAALEAQLGVVGVGTLSRVTVSSPIAGQVTRREAAVGMSVETGAFLFEVVDASTLWAEIDVPESEIGRVSIGLSVELRLDAIPDRVFHASIASVAPALDPHTRTLPVRAAIDNADGVLKANLYGTARIVLPEREDGALVPAAAVQRAKGVDLVFVRVSEDTFEARRVSVVSRGAEQVRLRNGVVPGEFVVIEGAFLLKTETLKDSIGAGCCDPE